MRHSDRKVYLSAAIKCISNKTSVATVVSQSGKGENAGSSCQSSQEHSMT